MEVTTTQVSIITNQHRKGMPSYVSNVEQYVFEGNGQARRQLVEKEFTDIIARALHDSNQTPDDINIVKTPTGDSMAFLPDATISLHWKTAE